MDRPTIEQVVSRARTFAGKEVEVSELSGGLTNVNYLVAADGIKHVVRIPGRSTELLAVDRENERQNATAAATTGVSPRVVEVLREWDVMVLEFVEGRDDDRELLRSPEQANRMADSLKRLHTAPPFRKDFDMFRLTECYLGVVRRTSIRDPGGVPGAELDRVGEIERAFAAHPVAGRALPQRSPGRELHRRRLGVVDRRLRVQRQQRPRPSSATRPRSCQFDQDRQREPL